MGRAGGTGGDRSGGGHSLGGGRSGGGRSSFSSGRNSSASKPSGSSSSSSFSSKPSESSSAGSRGSKPSGSSSSSSFSSKPSKSSSAGSWGSKPSGSSSGGFFGSKPSGGNSSGGGSFFNNEPPRQTTKTIIVNNSNNSSGEYYGSTYSNSNSSKSGCGCRTFLATVVGVMVFVILIGIIFGGGNSSSDITASTIVREKLPAGSVVETEYFTDELGWIGNKTELEKGMKNFYIATGVQPYLYITDNVGGEHITDVEQLADYASVLYDRLFEDEAHVLLVFYEYDEQYADYYLCGSQAKTVIDSEAGDILLDYVDKYYYDNSITDEEFFSTVFDKTATRIMTVEKSPWPRVWTAFIILLIIIVIAVFITKRKEQKIKKAQEDARILQTPLEEFGDDKLEGLTKKYEDDDSKE